MSIQLNEIKNSDYMRKSKNADDYSDTSKYKNRYERRLRQKVSTTSKNFNNINMDKLFREDILDVDLEVTGETDTYTVKLSFPGVIDFLSRIYKNKDKNIRVQDISTAIVRAFRSNDVYAHCTCKDWKYRFSYWSVVNKTSSDTRSEERDNGIGIANPDDTKGAGCKHVLAALHYTNWIMSVATVVFKYIEAMKKKDPSSYQKIIYPAIYKKPYKEINDESSDKDINDIDVKN